MTYGITMPITNTTPEKTRKRERFWRLWHYSGCGLERYRKNLAAGVEPPADWSPDPRSGKKNVLCGTHSERTSSEQETESLVLVFNETTGEAQMSHKADALELIESEEYFAMPAGDWVPEG